MVDWGCPEAQHRQVRIATAFLRLGENPFHGLHCSLYESIRPRIQRRACDVIEPISLTKDPKLSRGVLRAVVGDRPFWNAMLVEDYFQMIDVSARCGVSQCSYDQKLAVEVGN